jgi:ABC-type amino acid transport system permease subunit
MDVSKVKSRIPYAVLLVVAVGFYVLAGSIEYSEQPGQIGPTVWPRFALALIAGVCLFEIVRAFTSKSLEEPHGIADELEEGGDEGDEARRYPALLLGGLALTVAYGLLITTLGFPLATFLYLIAFMYLGGYRVHLVIWLSGFAGSVLLALIFLRLVYVSLPRGAPPFDRVTDLIVNLF